MSVLNFEMFVVHGKIGNIETGASRKQVFAEFGPPLAKLSRTVWSFGIVTITFAGNGLAKMLKIDLQASARHLPPTITIEGWIPKRGESIETVLEWLSDRQLTPSLDETFTSGTQLAYRFQSGVLLFFQEREVQNAVHFDTAVEHRKTRDSLGL